jgi:hypothetical protein
VSLKGKQFSALTHEKQLNWPIILRFTSYLAENTTSLTQSLINDAQEMTPSLF